MSTKRSFASVPVPDVIAKLAAEAPGGSNSGSSEIGVHQAPVPARFEEPVTTTHQAQPIFREREATQKMTVNMPKDLYEALRAYMKLTDVPMSDVLVEGARRELERLKKLGGGQ